MSEGGRRGWTFRGAALLAFLVPAWVLAHGGESHPPSEEAATGAAPKLDQILTWWTWDPLAIAGLLGAATFYAAGVTRLWRRAGTGGGLRRWEVAAFVCGWGVVATALLSPVDGLSDVLFSAHMSQHELLMLVAAPLLVMSRPFVAGLWALSPTRREQVVRLVQGSGFRRYWRRLTGPLLVLVLHGLIRWAWHIPALYQAALRNEWVHALQHATFFFSAALFWWALVYGRYGRAGYGVAVLFVFVTAAHTSLLGALLTFSSRIWYPLHAERTRSWAVSALEDQRLAGLIMWVPAGALFLTLGLGFFAAWLGESERRGGYPPSALGELPSRENAT